MRAEADPDQRVRAAEVVDDVMLHAPTTWGADLTTAAARRLFDNPRLHAVLLVEGTRLLGVLLRADLEAVGDSGAEQSALVHARLGERVVPSGAPLEQVEAQMVATGSRRLAVTDAAGDLVGLVCRKRSGSGYCTDAGVSERRAERRGTAAVVSASAARQVRVSDLPADARRS